MHISDMLGQYNRNISSGTEELKAASGMQKVVSTLEELSSGSVFEGTVSSVKNAAVNLHYQKYGKKAAKAVSLLPMRCWMYWNTKRAILHRFMQMNCH